MKKVSFVLGIALTLMTLVAMPISAQGTQSQEMSQELEMECESSNYGQFRCWTTGEVSGEQFQKIGGQKYIFTKDGRLIHKMADTGLDPLGMASVLGLMASGSVLAINKFKNRA